MTVGVSDDHAIGEVAPAEARNAAEQLLYSYTEFADRRDLDGVTKLLDHATVSFPNGIAVGGESVRRFFEALWAFPGVRRHVVTNLRCSADQGVYVADAHYTRWLIESEPRVTALGEYRMRFAATAAGWTILELTVTRTWSA